MISAARSVAVVILGATAVCQLARQCQLAYQVEIIIRFGTAALVRHLPRDFPI